MAISQVGGSELSVSKHTQLTKGTDGTLRNVTIKPKKKIICYVPYHLVNTMRTLQSSLPDEVRGSEFALYLKAVRTDDNNIMIVENDYILPKQEVTSAHIDFVDNSDNVYNSVIHKHPDGCTSFSGTDEEYINSNHVVSLLFVSQEITIGVCNIDTPYGRIRCDIEIKFYNLGVDISKYDLKNVTKKVVIYTPTVGYSAIGYSTYQEWQNYQHPGNTGHQLQQGKKAKRIKGGHPMSLKEENPTFDKEEEIEESLNAFLGYVLPTGE